MSSPEMLNRSADAVVELGEKEKNQRRKRMIELGQVLDSQGEFFSFPGINSDGYAKIKATEEEYPDFSTPIDDLIERFKQEGMKVVLGAHPESGNVYVLPALSDDIEHDSVPFKHLQINSGMDKRIEELIILNKKENEYYNRKARAN